MSDFWQGLKNRRAVREFEKKDVPKEIIRKIIGAVHLALSGSNQKNWRFIAVSSLARMIEESLVHFQISF